MITITLIGLDQYTVAHYSKDHTKNIADLFETSEDNIMFVATDSLTFHKGVDQPSWNSIVRVNAPAKFEPLSKVVAKYLINTLKDFTISLAVEFYFFHDHDRYEYINPDYPRFLTEDNIVHAEEDSLEEGEELYEGNIFEGYEEQLDKIYTVDDDEDKN